MGKRRAASVSSDEESPSPNTSKRARTEEPDQPPVINNTKKKGKGKQVVLNTQGDGDGMVLDEQLDMSHIIAEEDDEAFEAKHGKEVEEAVQNRAKKKGAIAEMGVIETIEMHQFMCHGRLSFKFGPQLNFIIGGKSAVLTALTIALGGKAASTGRGSGLKSFIREGQHTAEVTVGIKNKGEEAYKPDTYGERIHITRRFSRDGSSSFKIKSAEGKTVSTKREELTAICDHMNIQVDNPMNIWPGNSLVVLLQVRSTRFVYVVLTQLSEEYQTCFENIGKTTRTLNLKNEELPDLEQAVKEAELRNEQATKAREKQDELDDLYRELAWAHVNTKQEELTKSLEQVARARRRLPKIQDEIDANEKTVQETNNQVQEYEAEKEALPSIDAIEGQYQELRVQSSKIKDEIRECKADEKNINQQITQIDHEIEGYEREIRKVAESQGTAQTHRQQVQQQLDATNAESDATKNDLTQARDNVARLAREVDEAGKHGRSLDDKITRFRGEIESATNNIAECHRFSQDQLRLFGKDVRQILKMVQEEKWMGKPPVGPFGRFVTLKEASWAPIIRIQLGSLMYSWAVTDNRDRYKLRNILDKTGNQNAEIIITEEDLFDYTRGEPPGDLTTVLRVLEIKDEFVKRILINRRRIERVVLASTRIEGDDILFKLGGGGTAWCLDYRIALRYPEGGGSTNHMTRLQGSDPRHHMFTGGDRTTDLRHWEKQKEEAERNLGETTEELRKGRTHYAELRKQLEQFKSQENRLRARLNELEQKSVRLQGEVFADAPVNVSFIEASIATELETKQNLMKQFESLHTRRVQLDETGRALMAEADTLNKQREEHNNQERAITEKLTATLQSRVEAQKIKSHYERKLADGMAEIETLEAQAKIVEKEFEVWSNKAEEVGERFQKPRKADTVQHKIDAIKKILSQIQKEQGATPEEIARELYRVRTRLENHRVQLADLRLLNDALKQALTLRLSKWMSFRRFIALRTKYQFQHYLWNRGYYGKVLFDHNNGVLDIKVQTEDQAGKQVRDKDPRSLSGGEKSYSTICLLLALWEAIQCPIRCLGELMADVPCTSCPERSFTDEFDVFMDSVNRRVSMKLMIDTANTSDKQYILITPQDMSNVNIGPTNHDLPSHVRSRKHHRHFEDIRNLTKRGAPAPPSGPMSLVDNFAGPSFFDNFDFFTDPDPTHGTVQYVSQQEATTAGLVFVDQANVVNIGVDSNTTLPVGGLRKSVRISSKKTYNGGLFVIDINAMPGGCSLWPAFWTVTQDNWPTNGEIDIIEGVNLGTSNQMTLHTAPGCTLDTSAAPAKFNELAFTGNVLSTVCNALVDSNSGCGVLDPNPTSFGQAIENNGGAVFAMLWDTIGIRIWHFNRCNTPADLTAMAPNPVGWPVPTAFWSTATCPVNQFFQDHVIVINTSLCGDFAGSVYPTSGCPATCAEHVADPNNFKTNSQWKINYVATYQ
ncbi:hypothetical protein Clacol_007567 [Clathrus columnatus]|uniref:GH16 domain-containing protein n=1 Tax=Clathrus columnatus TaxID=1419009 RepID=A0AAV5AN16_9AGAM|nr:hypothetical protein Clacol_007567 [Clathrus columnatus]